MMNATVRTTILKAGGLHLIRQLGRRGVRILLYHRFPEASIPELEVQCAHLRRHYNVVSLDDIDEWLSGEKALAPNSIAITVDDGYRDFFTRAYPVFRAYGIPVTIFLATAFLDRECWLWVDQLEYVFQNTAVNQCELSISGGSRNFALETVEHRVIAVQTVKAAAKTMSNAAKLSLIREELPALLAVRIPENPPADYAPLRWDEVREMTTGGISFGAHTQTHPILSSIASEEELRNEILGSKRRIEAELGRPVRHFSYPNGTWQDISSKIVDIVRRAGFRSAVVAQGGVNFRGSDAYLLRRNTVEPQTPEVVFGKYATGFRRN